MSICEQSAWWWLGGIFKKMLSKSSNWNCISLCLLSIIWKCLWHQYCITDSREYITRLTTNCFNSFFPVTRGIWQGVANPCKMIRYFSCGEYLLQHSHEHQVNNWCIDQHKCHCLAINDILTEQNILLLQHLKKSKLIMTKHTRNSSQQQDPMFQL